MRFNIIVLHVRPPPPRLPPSCRHGTRAISTQLESVPASGVGSRDESSAPFTGVSLRRGGNVLACVCARVRLFVSHRTPSYYASLTSHEWVHASRMCILLYTYLQRYMCTTCVVCGGGVHVRRARAAHATLRRQPKRKLYAASSAAGSVGSVVAPFPAINT